MVEYLDNATNALNRILNNLEENSEIYENTKTLKYVLESPLFINLYNIQNKLKKLKLENNNSNLLVIDDDKTTTTTAADTGNYFNDSIIENEIEFKLIKLKRLNESQTFGFTIILIQHPQVDLNETFVFVQDVEENSIAANANLEPIDQILAVNDHYLDKNGFQYAFNQLISNNLNLIELLVKKKNKYLKESCNNNKNENIISSEIESAVFVNNKKNDDYIHDSNQQMTFRDMVLNTEWTQVEVVYLENDPLNGFGFGITGNKSTGVVVKQITPGGAAQRDGNLRIGDHLFQIGEINVRSMSSEQVASVIRQIMQTQQNKVQFIVARPIRELINTPHDGVTSTSPNTNKQIHTATLPLYQNSSTSQIIETHKIIDNKIINLNNIIKLRTPTLSPLQTPEHRKKTENDKECLAINEDLITLSPVKQQQQQQPTATTLTKSPVKKDESIYIEINLDRESSSQTFGLSIATTESDPDNNSQERLYYINEIVVDSLADRLNKLSVYDELIEINYLKASKIDLAQINSILNGELNLKLKLRRNIKNTHKMLELKWFKLLNLDSNQTAPGGLNNENNKLYQIISCELDKLNTKCLGISLEGTVDIENGQETRSHHYIRSILKDGPIDKCNKFKIGDELLEINGHVLYNISYIDLLNILKNLPMKMLTIVCARYNNVDLVDNVIIPRQNSAKQKETHSTSSSTVSLNLKQKTNKLSNATNNNDNLAVQTLKQNSNNSSKTNKSPIINTPGRTPPIRSRSLELNGLAMWNTKINYIDLIKTDKGLGFSIIDYTDPFNTTNNAIVIRSLVPNGAAQLDGRLLPGYRLVSVNNTSLENSALDFAVKCLKEAPKGVVKLGIQKPLPYPYSMNDLHIKTKSTSSALISSKIPKNYNQAADEDDEDDFLNDKINETIKLLNNKRNETNTNGHSTEQNDDDNNIEYGCAATSAPAILNQDYRIHYQIDNEYVKYSKKYKFKPNLDNVNEMSKYESERLLGDLSTKTKTSKSHEHLFNNNNSNNNNKYNDNSDLDDFFSNGNYNDDDDDDYCDYDDNETDSTNTSCTSSNSIQSSLPNQQSPNKLENKKLSISSLDSNNSLIIKHEKFKDHDIDQQLEFDQHEYGEFVYSYENIRLLNNIHSPTMNILTTTTTTTTSTAQQLNDIEATLSTCEMQSTITATLTPNHMNTVVDGGGGGLNIEISKIIDSNNTNNIDSIIKSMSNSINSLHSCSQKSTTASTASSSSFVQKLNILGKEIIKLPITLEKEIRIKKNYDQLGLVVDCNHDEGINGCLVKEIKENSAIHKDKRLQIGDFILSVNNENMKKITNSTAKAILKRASLISSDIIIKYIPLNDANNYKENIEFKSTLSRATSANTSTSSLINNQLSPKHNLIHNNNNINSTIIIPNNFDNNSKTESEVNCKNDLLILANNNNNNTVMNETNNETMITKLSTELVTTTTTSSSSSSSQTSPSSTSSSTSLKLTNINEIVDESNTSITSANDLIASSLWGPPRTVVLERESGKSVGISIVGGKLDVFGSTSSNNSENFISGIFIKHVLENSPAGLNGTLKTGDRILKVNNVDLTNATHDKAVEVIRNATSPIIFVIQSLLCANYPNDAVEEQTTNLNVIQFDESNKYGYKLDDLKEKYSYLEGELFVVQLKRLNPNESLGLSLSGNVNLTKASVFICDIYPDSIAQKSGCLQIGDQIIEINGQILYGRAHSNVTPLIRSIKDIDVFLVILRNRENFDEMFKPSLNKLNEIKKLQQQSSIFNNNNNNTQPARRLSLADLNNQLNEENFIMKNRTLVTQNSIQNHVGVNNNNENNNNIKFKNVTLKKGPSGFGIAISEDRNNKLIIRGINVNGVAYQDGNLKVGDEIIAVNDIKVNTLKYDDVMSLLHSTNEPVEFRVVSASNSGTIESPINIAKAVPLPTNLQQSPQLTSDENLTSPNLIIEKKLKASSPPSVSMPSSPTYSPTTVENPKPTTTTTSTTTTPVFTTSLTSTSLTGSSGNLASVTLQPINPKTNKIKVGEESLIEIERGKLGLGLSIVGGSDTHLPGIIIHDIYENGAAFKDKRLAIGDQILKVNNIDLKNVTHDEALNILRRQTSEYIQLVIYRNYESSGDDLVNEEDKFDVFSVDLYKKFGKGLGLSIIGRRDGCGVFISHIIEGGCAAKDGRLMVGDLILEVNDKDIRKAPYNDVAFILKTLPPQTKVTLKVGRLKSNSSKSTSRKNSYASLSSANSNPAITPAINNNNVNHVENNNYKK